MDLEKIAQQAGQELTQRGLMLATAESCTGGLIAQVVTTVAGSSQWFERGFVTYSNLSKQDLLGVDPTLLSEHGAVSEVVARAMAEGALARSGAQVTLAVTGIAGPTGGSAQKPIGTVCLAWAGAGRETISETQWLSGDRTSIRRQAAKISLERLVRYVREAAS
jgi:nicotinamide-nucleotide amidase